jgi:FkbM family methyltransferase
VLRKLAAQLRATLRWWRRSSRISAALGGSGPQRLWLRVAPIVLLWAAPFVRPGNRGIPVVFTFRGSRMRAVLGEICEYEVLEEMFVDEVYSVDLPADASTIVDLGSNVGLAALYFRARWPGARVLAVEPNPAVLGRLRRNVAHLEGVTIAPVAVADRDGEGRLDVPSGSWSGRLGNGRGHPVATVTLDTLLADHRVASVDVLKFDIEGAEFSVLAVADLSPLNALVGELHPEHQGELQDLTTVLERDFVVHTEPHPRAARCLMRASRR